MRHSNAPQSTAADPHRQATKTERHGITAGSHILQIAVQCHLEVPEATVEREQNLRDAAQR